MSQIERIRTMMERKRYSVCKKTPMMRAKQKHRPQGLLILRCVLEIDAENAETKFDLLAIR
jgi:hypothetical protein